MLSPSLRAERVVGGGSTCLEESMGRRPQFDHDDLMHAALAVADAEGLEAVGIRSVARQLGVTPMAVYRSVADKTALLDALVEHVLLSITIDDHAGLDWPAQLEAGAHAIRRAVGEHRAIAPLLLSRPAITARSVAIRDGLIELLEQAGVPPTRSHQAERLLSTALLGFTLSEAAGRFDHHSSTVRDDDFAALIAMLRRAIEDWRDSA